MTRPFDKHLDGDELDGLVSLRGTSASDSGQLSELALREAQRHVESCQKCSRKLQRHQFVHSEILRMRAPNPSPSTPECREDAEWLKVAAGILPEAKTRELMKHAAQCGHCGPLLKSAAEALVDEATPDEERLLASLKSARPEWLKGMAQKLSSVESTNLDPTESRAGSAWRTSVRVAVPFAFAVCAGLLAVAGVWFGLHILRPDPIGLVANAYKEKRTIEMRIEGAPYVPWRQERGEGTELEPLDRPALARAVYKIAERLSANQDDVRWVQAAGRVKLLQGNAQSAVDLLERAKRLADSNESISVDLASAYILRGEKSDRPEDFGRAIDLLKSVLAAQPRNEVAQFNYAIALEKQLLKHDAIRAWQQFVEDYPDSPWDQDARDHLKRLQDEIRLRDQHGSQQLLTLPQIASALERKQFEEIDAHIEDYQDLAVQQWIPEYFTNEPSTLAERRNVQQALSGLARILAERHHDQWMFEILRSPRSPQIRKAVWLVAESERLVQSSDNDRALQEAEEAASLFEKVGIVAGSTRAHFTIAILDQLLHRNQTCAVMANQLTATAEKQRYEWIRIQGEIESGICASMDDPEGLRSAQEAISLAKFDRYRLLEFRAANVVSAVYWALGDLHQAWATDAAALRSYWLSDCPSIAGYNLLANLDDIVEDQEQWGLAAAILNESIPMISDHPDHAMRGFVQERFSEVLLRTGDTDGATKNLREAQALFQSVPTGTRRDTLGAEAEIGLARTDAARGQLQEAVGRLEKIRALVEKIPEDDLRLDYFQTAGIIWMHQGGAAQAEQNMDEALRLAEKGLTLASTREEKLRWSRKNERLYRAIVELKLRTNPQDALAFWEWYKGASVREQNTIHRDIGQQSVAVSISKLAFNPTQLGADAALVTYVAFPQGVSVWVWDTSGIQQRWIDIPKDELNTLMRRFSERCAMRDSNLDALRADGAKIYQRIFRPIEPLVAQHRRLVIEPDDILSLVPLEALVDSHGGYLSDRFSLSVTRGVEYLSASRKWEGISSNSAALVVGDPPASQWDSLPDAELEARSVAALFRSSHVLLNASLSESAIAREIPAVDVFHFSGHGTAGIRSAGLVLGNSVLFDSGMLNVLAHPRTQLVVFSSCVSARGTTGFFDDEDSLVERLAGAGIPEIVASRWMIDSAASSVLMQEFYRRLLAGETVSDSLRGAGKSLRAKPQFVQPYYWAAFAVFGRG